MSLRAAPAWTGLVIGLLFGALLGASLVIWRDRNGDHDEPRDSGDSGFRIEASAGDSAGVGARDGSSGEPDAEENTGRVSGANTGNSDPSRTPRQRAAVDQTLRGQRRNAIVLATEAVAPAVVSINVLAQQAVRSLSTDFWDRFLPGLAPQREYTRNVQNFGSGVIVSADGIVITNSHVVVDAVQIIVTLSDGRQFEAELIERVDRFDLALLRIQGDNLPVAPMAAEQDLQIGEWAIAIGSPFGYLLADTQPTVTVGVISALNRDITRRDQNRIYLGMIQTDAAINPGNSGGPLVNSAGEVVGINTFIFTESGGSIGIGFAVPIERARWVINEIREFGHYREANWGFTLRKLSAALVRYLELDDPVGFQVIDVREGSAAWKAGIEVKDILRAIDGVPLLDRDTVTRLVYEAMVGDRLSFQAERDGQTFSGTIVLEERP